MRLRTVLSRNTQQTDNKRDIEQTRFLAAAIERLGNLDLGVRNNCFRVDRGVSTVHDDVIEIANIAILTETVLQKVKAALDDLSPKHEFLATEKTLRLFIPRDHGKHFAKQHGLTSKCTEMAICLIIIWVAYWLLHVIRPDRYWIPWQLEFLCPRFVPLNS